MATSTIRIVIDEDSVCTGDEFVAHVYIDAPDAAINAVQGELEYDPNHINPIAVRYGDSFLRYWVTAPGLPDTEGRIPFIGGLPYPGFQGNDGKVMSIVFKADASGTASSLRIARDAQILLNDGSGTSTTVSYEDARIATIERSAVVCQNAPPIEFAETDTTPPLPFEVYIERNEKIYENRYFVAFDTTDDESGVAYYEVREFSAYVQTPWLRTSSPYELRTQGGRVTVVVNAVDGAGNIRTASASKILEVSLMEVPAASIMVVGIAVVAFAIILALCRRKKK